MWKMDRMGEERVKKRKTAKKKNARRGERLTPRAIVIIQVFCTVVSLIYMKLSLLIC